MSITINSNTYNNPTPSHLKIKLQNITVFIQAYIYIERKLLNYLHDIILNYYN